MSKDITRLGLQLGSVVLARHWLANWNLAYLDRRASCHPLSVSPLSKGSGTLGYLWTPLEHPNGLLGRFCRLSRRPPGQHVSKRPLQWLYRPYRPRLLILSRLLSRVYQVLRQLGPPSRLYRLRPFREGLLVWLCRTTEVWSPLYPRTFPD